MSTPLVSVLLPVRDAASTLPETLASLAAQTLDDFEILMVDDGSVDGSAALAEQRWRAPQPLRILRPGRVGLVAALQVGLAACRGRWVARLDGDDIATPQRLAKQAELLRSEGEVGIVGCLVESFSGNPGELGEGFRLYDAWINGLVSHDQIMRERFVESPFAHPSVMFRKQVVAELGGYRAVDWPEDYDLWLRAAAAGVRFAKVPEVLLRWRDHPARASRTDTAYSRASFIRCKAHYLANGPAAGRPVVIWGGGGVGRLFGKALLAEGARLTAFIDIDRRKVGGRRCGVPVLSPEALHGQRPCLLLAAVGSRGARALIRDGARRAGFVEGEDFLCAA